MANSNINKTEANESIGEKLLDNYDIEIENKWDQSIAEGLNTINLFNESSTKDDTNENKKDKVEISDKDKNLIPLNLRDVTENNLSISEEIEVNHSQGQGLDNIRIDSHNFKNEKKGKTIFGQVSKNNGQEIDNQNNIIIEAQELRNNQGKDLPEQTQRQISGNDIVEPNQGKIILKRLNKVNYHLTNQILEVPKKEKGIPKEEKDLPEQKTIISDKKKTLPKNRQESHILEVTASNNGTNLFSQNSEDENKDDYIDHVYRYKINYPEKKPFFNALKKKNRLEDLFPIDSILIKIEMEKLKNNQVKYHYIDLLTNQKYIVTATIDANGN